MKPRTLVATLLAWLGWPGRAPRRRLRNDAHGMRQARGYAAAEAMDTEEREAGV